MAARDLTRLAREWVTIGSKPGMRGVIRAAVKRGGYKRRSRDGARTAAAAKTTRRTGELQTSMSSAMAPDGLVVGSTALHGIFTETGTKRGQDARPYLLPTVEALAAPLGEDVADTLAAALVAPLDAP
jgi:hypothetical protein